MWILRRAAATPTPLPIEGLENMCRVFQVKCEVGRWTLRVKSAPNNNINVESTLQPLFRSSFAIRQVPCWAPVLSPSRRPATTDCQHKACRRLFQTLTGLRACYFPFPSSTTLLLFPLGAGVVIFVLRLSLSLLHCA